jgi:hypothetical protein
VLLINAIASGRRLRTFCYLAVGLFYSNDYVVLFPVGALLHDFDSEFAGSVKAAWLKAVLFLVGLFLCVGLLKWPNVFPGPTPDGMYWHMLAAALLVWSVPHWRCSHCSATRSAACSGTSHSCSILFTSQSSVV